MQPRQDNSISYAKSMIRTLWSKTDIIPNGDAGGYGERKKKSISLVKQSQVKIKEI